MSHKLQQSFGVGGKENGGKKDSLIFKPVLWLITVTGKDLLMKAVKSRLSYNIMLRKYGKKESMADKKVGYKSCQESKE